MDAWWIGPWGDYIPMRKGTDGVWRPMKRQFEAGFDPASNPEGAGFTYVVVDDPTVYEGTVSYNSITGQIKRLLDGPNEVKPTAK